LLVIDEEPLFTTEGDSTHRMCREHGEASRQGAFLDGKREPEVAARMKWRQLLLKKILFMANVTIGYA